MKTPFSSILDQIPESGIRTFFDIVSESDDVISLGVGEPDFLTPWTIREAAISALQLGYTNYTSNYGLMEFRSAVSTHILQEYNVIYDSAKEIIATNGVSEAADIVFRAILNPGDEVILPQPIYVCYEPLIRLTGATVIPLDTSDTQFVPMPEMIEEKITPKTKAIVLCYPSNPTGQSISKAVLEDISEIAARHDLWVISDEIYSDLTFDQEFVSFASLDKMRERTILLSGFSKNFAMTGWRIGYVCGPEELIKRACKIHQYSALCASIVAQKAAIEALSHGKKEVKKMRDSYRHRKRLFVNGLQKIGLPVIEPQGAFYCFPSIKQTGLSSQVFAEQLLKDEKVAVVPGHVFGKGGEGHVRCCFATEKQLLEEALIRIERFVRSL